MQKTSYLTAFGNRIWSLLDRHKLTLAYRSGLDLKSIAKLLDRSPTSVNKALNRFGVRDQYGFKRHFKADPRSRSCLTTIKALLYHQESLAEKNQDESQNQSLQLNEKLLKPPLETSSHIRKRHTLAQDEIIIKTENLLKFARQMKVHAQPVRSPNLNAQGYCFEYQGKLLKDYQLLIYINQKRLDQSLPIIHVEHITCD